jgi:hypothetical protein
MCAKPVCERCSGAGKCDPFEEKLARLELRSAFRRRIDEEQRFATRESLADRIAWSSSR